MKSITTYKYYDEKGRRLAIRAKKVSEFEVDITVLICSKKDAFRKKFARQALDLLDLHDEVRLYGDLLHPQRFTILNNSEFAKTFFNWANNSFFKLKDSFRTYSTKELKRGNEYIIKEEKRL